MTRSLHNNSLQRFAAMFLLIVVSCSAGLAIAQDAADKERATADRYLEVLLRRPRPGVALDRVYGYHVQNDSLETLENQLTQSDDGDAAQRQMVWGLIQLQRGRTAEAAQILAKCESDLSEDAACSFYLGRALLGIGQIEKAAEAMERAVERNPSRAEALPMFTELGRIYSRAGESEKSLSVWTRLEAMFPGDTRVGGQIARTLAEEGHFADAQKRYESLSNASRKPDEKIAFAVQAAEMRRRLGQDEAAREVLEKILARLRPGSWLHTDVRNRIEAGFTDSGDYDALAEYYSKQLESRPDDLALRTRLARIMITAGRLSDAKSLLESAVQRAPDNTEARLALIDVLVNQNDVSAAALQFEELSKRDPDNPDHLIRWGQILLDDAETPLQQRRTAAAAVWKRLASTRNDDAVTLSQIADRLRSIDQTDDAIALYKKSIELDPSSPQYREYLGEYLHSLGRKEDAIQTWRSIAQDDRRNRESLVRLAEVFGAFKLPALALDAWQEASQFDLTFAQEVRYATKLGEAKQYDEALRRLDRADSIAETPDEQEQLLKERISLYQASGALEERIAEMQEQKESVSNLRTLALMHSAAGSMVEAERAIRKAIDLAPDSPEVLLVAAELAERQNLFGRAAELYQRLATADHRFRSNYLQRVASLQVRLGQSDEAIETCQAIVDANPASPDSYLFLARTAFSINKDDDAIAALRRAMSVAPRDNSSRRMLASHFADRYRTDEAIELYWQAFNYERATDDKINIIRSLAPLYDRKADLDALIGRIEEINRKDGNARTTNLMIAAAHESVQDFGAARRALDQLLADQPRDVGLLETMVRLCDAADEIELAAEFQQRITELADTPENRFKLVQLQLEAGTIDLAQALSQRIAFVSDPASLGKMIRSAAARGDTKTAAAICEEALRNDNSLWDVKIALAQLLISDAQGSDENRKRAIELANEVRGTDAKFDDPAPTRRVLKRRPSQGRSSQNYMNNPMYWSQSSYQLARNMRIGRYASANYSYSSQNAIIEPATFGHARVIASTLLVFDAAKGKNESEALAAVNAVMDSKFPSDKIDSIDDPVVLWERFALASAASLISPNSRGNPFTPAAGLTGKAKEAADRQRKLMMDVTWRLAEVDPQYGGTPIISMLSQRMMSESLPPQQKPDMTPLSEQELERLGKLNARIQSQGISNTAMMGAPAGMVEMMLQAIVGFEFQLAGMEEKAAEFAPTDLAEDASYDQVLGAMQFYLRLSKMDQAEKLLTRLLPAARAEPPTATVQNANPTVQVAMSGGESMVEFASRHEKTLVDSAIARWTAQSMNASRNSTSLSDGYISTYVQSGMGFRSYRIRGPLSPRLMDQALVQQVLAVANQSSVVPNQQTTGKVDLSSDLIEHLKSPLEGASREENKTRQIFAAYAHWWGGRPEQCYQTLVNLCEQFPSDVDLQIERARLASELKQPRVALQALDSFNPLDSRMLVRKEMAAMNLAAEVGDTDRARLASERLFGMRLDIQTQLALADQLKRLGMNDQANAMLQRTRLGRMHDENTQMQIAQAFINAGDKEAGAEVAYGLLRRLSTGRSRSGNSSYYKQRVVRILQTAGRLEGLIERAKRRVESAPKSIRPKQELAELYVAAGRTEDANKVWETLSDDIPVSPQQMIARADAFAKARKHKDAMTLYLKAFEKDPSLFAREFHKLTNVARSAGEAATDDLFRQLLDFPIQNIPSYRMDELARLGSRSKLSAAKRDFLGHLIKSPTAKTQVFGIIRNVPAEQRTEIPGLQEAMIEAVCSDDAFTAASEIWQVRSRSSGGRAIGPLEDIVPLLREKSDAEKQFRKAAQTASENKTLRRNADFLIALLDSYEDNKRDAAIQSIRECIKREDDQAGNTPTVSSGLLWQAGQLLEKIDGISTELLVELYSEAKRTDTSSSGSSPQYTLDSRLVQTLIDAGRHAEARRRLLDLYAAVDYSSQNQYNPGYGDYQELQAEQWIAETLVACKAPIDALVIYRKSLADPGRFSQAKRWSGSRDYEEVFSAGADTAANAINSEIAVEHLKQKLDQWTKDFDPSDVELMEASPETISLIDDPSAIEIALRTAVSSDATRKNVEEFAEQLVGLSEKHPDSWRLLAVQLMAACHLGTQQVSQLADQLFDRLPDQSTFSVEDDQDSTDLLAIREYFDLFPIAKIAIRSSDPAQQKIGRRLSDFLAAAAEHSKDASIAFALAEMSGDANESVQKILALIESQSKPDSVQTEAAVEKCLRIATDATRAGKISTAMRALRLALQNGPPLRKLATGGDAFAFSANSRSSMNQPNGDSEIEQLAADVNALTSILAESTGLPLIFDQELSSKSILVDAGTLDEIRESYLQIFLPANDTSSVFSYAEPIATQSYDQARNAEDLSVKSVSYALAIAADRSEHVDALMKIYEERLAESTDKTELSIAMVQLAFVAKRYNRLEEAIDQLITSLEGSLPEGKKKVANPGRLTSIPSQVSQASREKSKVVNHVMHAIWPILGSDFLTKRFGDDDPAAKGVSGKLKSLLLRTQNLIHSDGYTASRHGRIYQFLSEKEIALARLAGDVDVIDQHLNSQLDSIETRNYPVGSDINEYKRRAMESMVTKIIDDGLIQYADRALRRVLTTRSPAHRNYALRFEPHICLTLSRLPAEQRLDLLAKITFGRSDEDPLAFFDGLVNYEVPPAIVSRQHPLLTSVMDLPVCSSKYPVCNTMLMLIETAVQTESSDQLAQTLQSKTKTKGDAADIGLALLRIALANDEAQRRQVLTEIRPTIDAVSAALSKDLPQKNDKTIIFPALEAHLIVRAYEAGLSKAIVEPMIRNLKAYAIRGQRNFLVSAIARATSMMGIGRAANGVVGSPIEHFDVVPIAARNRGDNALLPPLFSVRPGGLISGTSGYEQTHLMFKYPLAGTFTFSATIQDGSWGEADVAYGGVIYQANGWQKTAKVLGMGNRGQVEFKVNSIQQYKLNQESVSVSANKIEALCNGQPYVADNVTHSYPFVSVHHHKYRTTQFRDVQFSGNPTIPDEVNLIDPTMRGWGVLTRGISIPKMLMPIGPKQNEKQILSFREKMNKDLAEGPLVGKWSVRDGKLHYKSVPSTSRAYDPASHIEYLRPIQDKESLTMEFFWKGGETEFSPTIGRTILRLSDQGTTPDWIATSSDLASVGFIPAGELSEPYQPIAADNVPHEDDWNTLTMERKGEIVSVTLNGKPLIEMPIVGYERPGIHRDLKRDLLVRSIRLTGDWPKQVPAELIAN